MRGRTADGTAYALHGPEAGPPAVLIHGLGLRSGIWEAHLPALAAERRVVAYDLWGHGESAALPGPASLALFAGQLLGLLDHLGIPRAALVGFSLGGMINRRVAIDAPERVAGLAILNSPHERAPEEQARVEARARDTAAGGPGANLEETLARWLTPEFRAGHPERVAEIAAWVRANDPADYAACRRVLAEGVRELIRPAPPIACPALVMTSERDSGSTPAMARAIAAEIPGARTLIVPGLQHLGLIEAPGAFAGPLAEFLARLPLVKEDTPA